MKIITSLALIFVLFSCKKNDPPLHFDVIQENYFCNGNNDSVYYRHKFLINDTIYNDIITTDSVCGLIPFNRKFIYHHTDSVFYSNVFSNITQTSMQYTPIKFLGDSIICWKSSINSPHYLFIPRFLYTTTNAIYGIEKPKGFGLFTYQYPLFFQPKIAVIPPFNTDFFIGDYGLKSKLYENLTLTTPSGTFYNVYQYRVGTYTAPNFTIDFYFTRKHGFIKIVYEQNQLYTLNNKKVISYLRRIERLP